VLRYCNGVDIQLKNNLLLKITIFENSETAHPSFDNLIKKKFVEETLGKPNNVRKFFGKETIW